MSSSKEPFIVNTWLKEEAKFEYKWKIEEFPTSWHLAGGSILKNHRFLINAKTEDSSLCSKWLVYLDFKQEAHYHHIVLYCKLVEISDENKSCDILSSVTAQFLLPDGSTIDDRPEGGILQYKKLHESHRLCFAFPVLTIFNFKAKKYFDADGGATLLIKLRIFSSCYEISGAQESPLEISSACMAKMSLGCLLDTQSVEFDAKIISGDGKEFYCHQAILKATSPVFKAMLESGLSEEETGIINVSDISGKTLEVLVHYIYTGRLQEFWKESDVIHELMYAAGKYDMKLLNELIDSRLDEVSKNFTPSSRLALKNLAGKLDLKKADADLKESIITHALSAKSTDDIVDLFGNSYLI